MSAQDEFTPLVSTQGRGLASVLPRLLLRGLVIMILTLWLLFVLGTLAALPAWDVYSVVMVVICAVISGGLGWVVWLQGRTYTHVRIDREGVHYFNHWHDEVVGQVRWSEFRPSDQGPDVRFRTDWVISATVVAASTSVVWQAMQRGQTVFYRDGFEGGHLWYLCRNAEDLRRKLIEGLRRFRPDLKIEASVLKRYG